LWFKVIWGYLRKVVLHRKGIKMVAQFFWPLHCASITEAQVNFSSEARLHLPQRGGWVESSLAGADKLQACTIYSRESAIPLPCTVFKLDKTIDETSYAHHFLDILHTAMMKIIELPFLLRLGKA
jgi:hypothetical protein